MADGHENDRSVITRSNSRMLAAESVLNLVQRSVERGTNKVSARDETAKRSVKDLVTELSNTSSEAVIQKLAMEGTQELYRIRDVMLLYCISKWPECPKEKLYRRITGKGGQTGAEKLAADIVVLTRYGSSGVLSDEVADIFQKPRSVDNVLDSILDSSSLNQGGSEVSKELTKNVSALLEEMDLKLCEAKENYLESIDDMKIEVEK